MNNKDTTMSESDTPRTNELDDKLVDLSPNPETDYSLMKSHARKLERELTAVTEQRDRLQKIVDEQCRVSSVCREYREQRDRAWQTIAEIKRDIMEDETFGNVVIKLWQEPLDEAIEQRDRLAVALEIIRDRLVFYSLSDEYIDMADEALRSLNTNEQ